MFNERVHISMRHAQTAHYKTLSIHDRSLAFWVVSHVRSGCVETRTGAERRTVRSGMVMIHPPNTPFSEIAAGPGVHEFMFLDAVVGAGVDLLRLHPVALTVRLTDPRAWSETFARLLAAGSASPMTAFGCAISLLDAVIDDWRAAGAPPRPAFLETPADRFAGLVHYMTEHLSERIDRDTLASRMCLHPGSLNRAFRQAYGVSPMRLLRRLRLEHARRLLETTDHTLETIALQCGFEDTAYFSRAFRAACGLPPGRHRQAIREGVQSAMEGYSQPFSPPAITAAETTVNRKMD
ncbi:hypothetical protein CCAX7_25570 [Capsulimonas corticalis]|uniref:Uncharacterized protein n=1 Tax=Capsulimonas corticalis TaxID=2219043 RepID=A0A402CVT3_9BACT|nr:AraC family transcriptional regulator [Capsulimonas corticalis]BDI30506.1 hypothetical protein CCAX7_25570 [Capsulimonas corticalis]